MTAKNFKELIELIDQDFQHVAKSKFPRNRLYYTVTLGDRKSNLIARKAIVRGGSVVNFLLARPVNEITDHSSMLYISDLDIVEMLSTVDKKLLRTFVDFLVDCILETVNSKNFVQFEREGLYIEIEPLYISTAVGVPLIEYAGNEKIKTPQGMTFSLRDFCDLISLIMAKEGESKMKTTATKYIVLTNLVKPFDKGIPVIKELNKIRNIDDIRSLYEPLGTNAQRRLDERLFDQELYATYFESMKSKA